MAEEATIISGATPTPEPVATPSAPMEATVLTPESVTPVVEEVTPEPVAEPVGNVEETVIAEEKPPLHTDKPTLLEETEKPEEKPPEEAKPEVKPEAPEEPFKYEPFKLPEGVPVDENRITAFQDIIAPHKLDQDTAQKLVDMHVETMRDFQNALVAKQHSDFAETRRQWVDQIRSDPVLGGPGHLTALRTAARMRDLLVSEEHRAEFADFMRVTGAGDHPAMMRLLHNAARFLDEPAPPPTPARPVPDRGGNGPVNRQAVLYDHPTSRRVAGRN